MNNFIGILIILCVIGLLVAFFSWYTKMLFRVKVRGVEKKIESGKISDDKLMRYHKNTDSGRKSTAMAVLSMGFLFKYYLKLNEACYQLYHEEAIRRGLVSRDS